MVLIPVSGLLSPVRRFRFGWNTFLAAGVLLASHPALAWEEPLSAPSPPDRTRGAVSEALYGTTSGDLFSPRYGYIPDDLFCQTLDAETHPLTHAIVTYSPKATFGGFGESATAEFKSAWRLFALEEFLAGYLEGFLDLRLLSFVNDPNMSSLPDVASHLAFDTAMSWRFVNGGSMEVRVAPGIYSDITAPQFNCPVTLNFHITISPEVGGVGGLTVRPGWDLPIMPNVGLAWQPNSVFRLEAMLPRSRVMLSPFEVLTLFGTVEWRNFDFALEEKPGVPAAFTVDEWLATAGVMVRVGADHRISAEFGTYLHRQLSADVEAQRDVEISEEWLVRLGWHGAF